MKQVKKTFQKTVVWIKKNKLETIIILAILLLAAFLRFYKLRSFVIFLGDEGRDALVVKRILIDHKLTLLGPTASVGGFYIGPIYYYMIAPFMLLSGLDPVGPAIFIALTGIATVILLYSILRKWFGSFSATLASLLYTISPGIVNFSRSSWNPNPMPFFSLLSVVSLYFGIVQQRIWLTLISGIAYGISFQLHYLGLLIGPIVAVLTFFLAKPKDWIKLGLTQILGFFIGASLYFAFEIRHGFPNIRSVIEFINRGGSTTGLRSLDFYGIFQEMNRFNFESILGRDLAFITKPVTLVFFFLIIVYLIWHFKSKQKFTPAHKVAFIFWFVGTFIISFYKGQLHYHYFEFLFPTPFIVLAMLLSPIKDRRLQIFTASIVLATSGYLLTQQSIWAQGSNLIDQTKNIALEAKDLANNQEYNFALITQGNSDHAYRFFLEINQAKPVPLEEKVTSQLIIICELKPQDCQPLGHPIWEIAGFGRAEIEVQKTVHPGITIFKLIHHPQSQDLIGQPAPKG